MVQATKSDQLPVVGSQAGMKSLAVALQEGLDNILPNQLDAGRLLKLACLATSKEPKLLQCTKQSMILALTASAELALDPSGTLGMAWIVPFFDHKQKVMEAVFIAGWKGLVQLVYRSGRVESIMPAAVYEQDIFEYQLGDSPILKHTPARPTPDRKCWIATGGSNGKDGALAGSLIGAYVTWTVGGVRSFKFKWAEELEKLRLGSKAPLSPAYRNYTEDMLVKGVVRAAIAIMPLSEEDRQSIARTVKNEDEKMGLKNFIDIDGEPVKDGAHPIKGTQPATPSDGAEGNESPLEPTEA